MNTTQNKWHTLEFEEVVEKLFTHPENGLSTEEVEMRLNEFGENRITSKKMQSSLVRFLLQFNQPLIYILLGATIITLLLQEYTDSAVIFGVVLLNSIIGYVQETRALKAIDALSKSMSTTATVIRNGRQQVLDSTQLVPGDLVKVKAGDKIPADLRLIAVKSLQVDESALTGESVATEKSTSTIEAEALLGDRHNLGFASTVVTYGTARGLVIDTGDRTEVGKINQSIATAEELDTPLTLKIKRFSHMLLWVILSLSITIMAVAYFRGEALADAFMVAVALMVGAIPGGTSRCCDHYAGDRSRKNGKKNELSSGS